MKIKLLKYTVILMFGIINAGYRGAKFIGYDKASWQGIFFKLRWVTKDHDEVIFHGSPLIIEGALEVFYQKDQYGHTPILFISPTLVKGMIELTIFFKHLNPMCPFARKPDGMGGGEVYYKDKETGEVKPIQNRDVWISGEATLLPSYFLYLITACGNSLLALMIQPKERLQGEEEYDKIVALIEFLNTDINTLLTPEAKEYIERVKPLCVNSPKEFLEKYPDMFDEEETKIMQSHIAQSAVSFDNWKWIHIAKLTNSEALCKRLADAYIKDNQEKIIAILQEPEGPYEGYQKTIQEFCKEYDLKDIKAVEKKIFSIIIQEKNRIPIFDHDMWALITTFRNVRSTELWNIEKALYEKFGCLTNHPLQRRLIQKTMHNLVTGYININIIRSSPKDNVGQLIENRAFTQIWKSDKLNNIQIFQHESGNVIAQEKTGEYKQYIIKSDPLSNNQLPFIDFCSSIIYSGHIKTFRFKLIFNKGIWVREKQPWFSFDKPLSILFMFISILFISILFIFILI